MNIVLEGPDGAGKSTLARKLSIATGEQIILSEGPAMNETEINDRATRYLKYSGIFDRHPAISNEIYTPLRDAPGQKQYYIKPKLVSQFYEQGNFLVYCRAMPNDVLNATQSNDYDNAEYTQWIKEKRFQIVQKYDLWAVMNANYIYRKHDSISKLLKLIRPQPIESYFDNIRQFHEKFNQCYNGPPKFFDREMDAFRIQFLTEELHEYVDSDKLEDKLDALVDLTYVALGTAYLHGFDFDKAWERVHAANMKKVRAERASQSKRGTSLDVIKPHGWIAPNLKDLVE